MNRKIAAVSIRRANACPTRLDARLVHDHRRSEGITIDLCGSGTSTMLLWPSHKTIDDVERDAFMSGQTGVVDIITRYAEDLLDGTIPADEAKEMDERLDAATSRVAALEEAAGHIVVALRAAERLNKAQSSALAAVLVEIVREPGADMKVRINLACGLGV